MKKEILWSYFQKIEKISIAMDLTLKTGIFVQK